MIFICLVVLVFTVIVAIVAIKINIKSTTQWNNSSKCLLGKTAIVTGANTGIGYITALNFAMRGARVILVCRDERRACGAKSKIVYLTGNENVVVKLANFNSFQSVRDICKDINENEDRIDILVNNAGAAGVGNRLTKDGMQLIWQINHLSPFLMTHLLLEKMKKTKGSRVIVVSSRAASFGDLTVDKVNTYKSSKIKFLSERYVYNLTKQANILFTRELARRLRRSFPTVNAVHPGTVTTDIWRKLPPSIVNVAYFIMLFIFKTPEEGAQTTLHCALNKDLDNVTGRLFDECTEIEMYDSCADMNLAKQVWKKCEELVKLEEHEKIPE